MGVHFYFLASTPLNGRKDLKKFITWLAENEGHSTESLSIIFCSDEYLLDINKQYLNHNYFTDIITFDLADMPGFPLVGEIYISVDRVKENANEFKTAVSVELHRVIFHGILHLCGYKDKKKSDKALMTEKENFYLNAYLNVPRGA